jgi:hypothetical protein
MVEGFTGMPGSGKTYWVVKLALDRLKRGDTVYANFKIDHPNVKRFHKLQELFEVRKGVIIVDEINLVCPSRWWNKFPPELAYFWSQTRKFGLDIYWTAQHYDRVDKIVKEITNFIWWIRPFPFKIRRAKRYIPEQISKEKRQCFKTKYFKINKTIYDKFDTYEAIDIQF